VPSLEIFGPELLQFDLAEVRNDLTRGELVVTLECLGRYVCRVGEEAGEVLADSHL
jgi:hypothetical protein